MPAYDGVADYEQFEAFISKWDSWLRSKELSDKEAVEHLRHALTGKASAWYTNHVAMQLKGWTMRRIYREMYESCFPMNFREDLRDKMMAATQHGRPIKDYAKDLENMALRYDDIDKGTVKRILWDGVDDYIRLYWIEKGLSLEFSDVKTLLRTLPSAAVGVMFASVPSLNHVVTAAYVVEAEKGLAALLRDKVVAAALDWYNSLSCSPYRGNLTSPRERFIVETPESASIPGVASGYVSFYDVLHGVELEFRISDYRYDEFDFGQAYLQHYGISYAELERPIRYETPALPWGVPLRGALTYVDGFWIAGSTLQAAVEQGLDSRQRWILQTNGIEYWMRDRAYGLCFEVDRLALWQGTTLAAIIHGPEFFDGRGQLDVPLDKCYALEVGADWTFPFAVDERVETRALQWKALVKFRLAVARGNGDIGELWAAYHPRGLAGGAREPGRQYNAAGDDLFAYSALGLESVEQDDEFEDVPLLDARGEPTGESTGPPSLESEPTSGSDGDDDGDDLPRVRTYRRAPSYDSSTSESERMWSSDSNARRYSDDAMDVDRPRGYDTASEPEARGRPPTRRGLSFVAVQDRARAAVRRARAIERGRQRRIRAREDPVVFAFQYPEDRELSRTPDEVEEEREERAEHAAAARINDSSDNEGEYEG
ncbi:hypothetical protein AURDEDRAFT_174262 [Auricularia subglabra TFB-10046 SS5]|uniref:Retrotransposon gag domain-containing protein n=1 Tax=Auricularia subglabra (strain TFB-10046 / SS5) TaxID=717982 RepID=J0WTD8_AURST|nr:hypothetical protein AURDEDRAFT_174262 [Auricularia subglabra TFB-10046 SS5]